MYQALSLEADVNAAKVLAFSYPKLREGVLRAEQAETALTAIVESELEREDDVTMFALETLTASRIMVATTAELPRIAAERAAEDGTAVGVAKVQVARATAKDGKGLLPRLASKGRDAKRGHPAAAQGRIEIKNRFFREDAAASFLFGAGSGDPARGSK